MPARARWPIVTVTAGLLAVAALGACTRREASDASPVAARVAGLIAELEGDETAATRAAAALATLGPADAAAVPTLMRALACAPAGGEAVEGHDDHHPHDHGGHAHGACNDHVVLAVAAGLGAIGGASVPPLVALLRNGGETERTFAGFAFAHMHPSATPALRAALDDTDPRIRLAVVGAIRGMQPPPADARSAIAGRLGDPDPEVRTQAADTLGHFGPAAVADIVGAFDDDEPSVRASAASALRLIGPPARAAAPALVTRLGDPAPAVRLNAAAALAAVGADDRASVDALAAALGDADHTVRWGSALALGRLGAAAADAAPALARAAEDPHPLVRTAASDALARIRSAPPR